MKDPGALCKFRGMLVLYSVEALKQNEKGSCPDCGSTRFVNGSGYGTGWTECTECDFAVFTKHLQDRVI